MLFEDVGRGVWSSVVYCGCITSGLVACTQLPMSCTVHRFVIVTVTVPMVTSIPVTTYIRNMW